MRRHLAATLALLAALPAGCASDDPASPDGDLDDSDSEDISVGDLSEADLKAESDPQAAADRLVATALAAGATDNVTVLVVDAPAVLPSA